MEATDRRKAGNTSFNVQYLPVARVANVSSTRSSARRTDPSSLPSRRDQLQQIPRQLYCVIAKPVFIIRVRGIEVLRLLLSTYRTTARHLPSKGLNNSGCPCTATLFKRSMRPLFSISHEKTVALLYCHVMQS